MKYLLTLLFACISIHAFSQFSISPRDTVIHPTFLSSNPVIIYDYNRDSFDDIIYYRSNQLLLIEQNNYEYKTESVIFTFEEGLQTFSNIVDINDDGYVDFAISSKNNILLLTGSESGLQIFTQFTISDLYPNSITIEDYDGDEDLDIIYNSYNKLMLIENDGDNTFLAEKEFFNDYNGVSGIIDYKFADFNRDGDKDVLLGGYNNSGQALLYFLENDGDNQYSGSKIFDMDQMNKMELEDMNLDGYLDVVVFDNSTSLKILLYTPSGFTLSQTLTDGVYFNLMALLLMDYDKNGKPDIIVRSRMTDVMILYGNGDGTVQEAKELKTSIRRVNDFKVGNFNNDGEPDLFGIGTWESLVTVLPLGSTIPKDSAINIAIHPSGTRSEYVDLDADELQDIVTFSRNGGVFIHYGTELGLDSVKMRIDGGYWAQDGLIADVDQDGKLDLVLAHESHSLGVGKLVWAKNLGNRSFDQPINFKYLYTPELVSVCDYNKDGVDDILAYQRSADKIAFFSVDNPDFDELWNPDAKNIIQVSASRSIKVTYGDMNNDDWIDIVVGYFSEGKVTYFPNDQAGGFGSEVLLYEGKTVTGVGVGNIDEDDKLELFIGIEEADYSSTLQIRDWDDTEGEYLLKNEMNTPGYSVQFHRFITEDIDNNGFNDLVAGGYGFNPIYFLLNDGNGNLNKIQEDQAGNSRTVNIADYNKDGLLDIISADEQYGSIYININNSVFEPTTLQTKIDIDNTEANSAEVKLNLIDASGRLVLMKKGSKITNLPEDGQYYSANTLFGIGKNLGEETYAVYSGSDTTFNVTGLEEGQIYHVAVFEYNQNAPQNTLINYLIKSYEIDSVFIKSSQTLEWIGPVEYTLDEQSFTVQIIASSGLPVNIELVSGPVSFTEGTVSFNDVGECLFRAVQPGNNEYVGVDSTFTINIVNITALNVGLNEGVKVYPNPASNILHIDFHGEEMPMHIHLLSFDGRLIDQQKIRSNHNEINLADLESGIYVLEIWMKDTKLQKKIIRY